MKIVLTVDDDLIRRARHLAQQRNMSLQEMILEQLRIIAGEHSGAQIADELLDLMNRYPGNSGGSKGRREDAYEGV